MRPLDVVPEPLAQLPWKIILLTLMIGGFGLMMLYSAAGGSVRPWVIPQGVRLIVFLIGAMVMSRIREQVWRMGALPASSGLLVLLILIRVFGPVHGGSPGRAVSR